jgi:MFS family permease
VPVTLAVLRVRNYRIWAVAGFVSTIGTWMQLIAQNWLVLHLTGSGAALGLCVSLQAMPAVFAGLWGGSVADRVPSQWLLRRTQSAFAVLAGTLGLLTVTGMVQPVHVFALAFAVGCVAVFDGPAGGRFGAELVPPELLGNAIALGSAFSSAGRVLGMALAGVVVAVAGPGVAFLGNAASFAAVLAAVSCIRRSEVRVLEQAPAGTGTVRAVLSHLRSDHRLQVILGLAFVCGSFGRNYQVTMALMNSVVFEGGPKVYGVLSTVFAVGGLVGALAAARVRQHTLRLLFGVAAAGCLLELVAGLSPNPGSFAAALAPIALTAVVLDTSVSTLAQLGTPEALRGRVLALVSITGAAAGAVGAPALGELASLHGPRAALVGGAAVVAGTLAGLAALHRRRDAHAALGVATEAGLLLGQVEPVDALATLERSFVDQVGRDDPRDFELDAVGVLGVEALGGAVIAGADKGTPR